MSELQKPDQQPDNREFIPPDPQNEALERLTVDERLESIIASLDDAVWSALPHTYQTIFMSSSAEKIFGRPAEDFYRYPNLLMDCVSEKDRARVMSSFETMLYQQDVLDLDYRVEWPDGTVHWIHDHVRLIRDARNEPARLDGISVDITKHKLAEEELQQRHEELKEAYRQLEAAQTQLLQSEKMASIGQLAAGVAHEINNPIGYVYSNLGSLQKYLDNMFSLLDAYEKVEPLLGQHPDATAALQAAKSRADIEFLKEDISSLMEESREGITRVKKIVQNLKDFSHAGSDEELQWSDLRQGLDSTLSIVWNELKYKTEIVKEYSDIPDVECLPSQLNQVFMNLLVNAGHAIEEKGIITIRTGAADGQVWVEIEDTGKGIDPEHLTQIFNPFFTTKPVGKGTGLGLSVSYSIIQKHHGDIQVRSEPGKGTAFRITLPVRQENADG